MRSFIRTIMIVVGLSILFFGNASAADKIPVYVSIVPQKFFVQQIGKDLVEVQAMVSPGASPATYEPKPRQMADLSKTRIYFAVGVPYESAWLDKIAAANPQLKVVHTDAGIEKLAMAARHRHEAEEGGHAHDENDHHDAEHHDQDHPGHIGLDPHIWLSPPLVKKQARAIAAALQEVDPAHGSLYEANLREFAARIDQLDGDLKKTFAGKTGLQFMVFHPSWGYFARAYGLRQVPIEIEGKTPKPAQLKKLIQHAREIGVKVVFVQPQFSTKSARVVAREIGGQVVFADPLAENWMENLRKVADKFQAVLK